MIYTNLTDGEAVRNFPVDLALIKRVTLSPWMHKSLRGSVARTLRSLPGCKNLSIARSTLIGNSEWQSLTDRVTESVD